MNALLDAREIAALVSMSRLLRELGFEVNERTRRAPCLLHSGSNLTAFAWREARWRCFSCGRAGDKIALVRAARQCSFRDAVDFLAILAGVEYEPGRVSREAIQLQKQLQESETAEADVLLALEFSEWHTEQDELLRLETIRRYAAKRLDAIYQGASERWPGEAECAWAALAMVHRQMPRAAARYYVISFAQASDRFAFAMDPETREELTDEALERGWVADSKGHRVEVQL